MIYHLIKKESWDSVKKSDTYLPNSLEREGYIHCSFENQVVKVADTIYKGQNDIMLISIDEKKLGDLVRYENLFNLNEEYPHVYGPIPLKAVVHVQKLVAGEDGCFLKPEFDPLVYLKVKEKEWT